MKRVLITTTRHSMSEIYPNNVQHAVRTAQRRQWIVLQHLRNNWSLFWDSHETHKICAQNTGSCNVKGGGTYSNHSAFKRFVMTRTHMFIFEQKKDTITSPTIDITLATLTPSQPPLYSITHSLNVHNYFFDSYASSLLTKRPPD